MRRVVEVEMRRELVGEPAHLASPHGVGLTRDRERAHAGPADATRHQMAVDDRVDLISAGRGLVDALRIHRDDPLGRGEQSKKRFDLGRGEAGGPRQFVRVEARGGRERFGKTARVGLNEGMVGRGSGEMRQQAVEQRDVAIRLDGEMEVGLLRGRGAARIDDDEAQTAGPARLHDPLEQHRVTPSEVGAYQHHEIGFLEVCVGARHRVGPEGAFMAGHRGGHAEAGVGVDVGRADEALHQLVSDVIVLGQQLAGYVKRDRVRAVLGDHRGKAPRHEVEGIVPIGPDPVYFRVEQPVVERQGRGQGRTLGAEPPVIGRVVWIAPHGYAAVPGDIGQNPAAHPAIGACRLDRAGLGARLVGALRVRHERGLIGVAFGDEVVHQAALRSSRATAGADACFRSASAAGSA